MKVLPISYNIQYKQPVFTGKVGVIKNTVQKFDELAVFRHHIYEYKKGVRSMILTTEKSCYKDYIVSKLEKDKIPYLIHDVSDSKINVFFGNQDCINVISTFDKHLNKLSPEQDFIVGILLGYDKMIQCRRYMKNIAKKIITG